MTTLHIAPTWVYLYHLSSPLGSEKHIAQHYLGSTIDLHGRDAIHQAGHGAKLLAAAKQRGIAFSIVRIWPGDRDLERHLKRGGNFSRLCPSCSGSAAWRRGVFAPPEQLQFDFDAMPEAPALRPDWLELSIEREFRSQRLPARTDLEAVDACLY